MNAARSPAASQRGVATISITMILLLVMSLASLSVNRVLILHQRGSANEYRAAQAFEAAEAGLTWATTLLNDPRAIDDNCLPKAGAQSFRARYLPSNQIAALEPDAASHPGCQLGDGAMTCTCPTGSAQLSLGDREQPVFSVSFAAVPKSPDSVLITAQGCTGPITSCVISTKAGISGATARVSAVLRLKPLIRVIPGAALTAGGDVSLSGTSRLQNTDRTTNGALVHAGGLTTVDAQVHLLSLPGAPVATALMDSDPSLAAPTTTDGVFNTFFAASPTRFATASGVRKITGDSPSTRAAALLADYELGYLAFRVDGPLQFDTSSIGSAKRPVLIVTSASIGCTSACQLNGMVYNDMAMRSSSIGASIEIRGAMVTAGSHRQSNGESAFYDLDVLTRLRHQTQSLVRVPGSWRDL